MKIYTDAVAPRPAVWRARHARPSLPLPAADRPRGGRQEVGGRARARVQGASFDTPSTRVKSIAEKAILPRRRRASV